MVVFVIKFERIYYEKEVLKYEQGKKLLEMYKDIPHIEIKSHNNIEELRKYEIYIEEYIMSHSSKNGDISRLSNQYNSILNTLVKENLN